MTEPVRIHPELVLAIHARQLAEHGGPPGLRDAGLLTSALAHPRQECVYGNPAPDIPALAAAYAFALVQNHPFIDANKRTAYIVCRTFLLLNGHDIDAPRNDRYRTFLALADGALTKTRLAHWLRTHLIKQSRK